MADRPASRSRLVDYDHVADLYDERRALAPDIERTWRTVVEAHLPHGPLRRVLDVGAGTGLFLPMWRDLGATSIVAVEPSPAMRARAAQRAVAGASVMAGTAAELPVASAACDAAWLSASIHHFPDLDAATAELGRALRRGGRIFVRGYVPDASSLPTLDLFPGADRARARYPTTARLARALEQAGFGAVEVVDVVEPQRISAAAFAEWVGAMRHADSLLTALRDDEVDEGIAALRRLGDAELPPASLTLVVAQVS